METTTPMSDGVVGAPVTRTMKGTSANNSDKGIKFDPNKEAASIRLVDDDFSPISEKASCIVILSTSHLAPRYNMAFPAKFLPDLPSTTMPALISCRDKIWKTVFLGNNRVKRLEVSWKALAIENNLEVGDALAWEALEITKHVIKFKVQIIKGKFPFDLPNPLDKRGATVDDAIVLD